MDEFDEIAAGLTDVEGPAAIGSLADHLRAVTTIVETMRTALHAVSALTDGDTTELLRIIDDAAGQAKASMALIADTIDTLAQAAAGEGGL